MAQAGWSAFSGGTLVTTGCIPDIPTPSITPFGGNSELFCDSGVYFVDVRFDGGVLPVAWATTMGQVTVTGQRTARVKIHSAISSPVIFTGYVGDIRCTGVCTPPVCNDSTFHYAYVRLGKELLDKGIFTECRHGCNYLAYDCAGIPANGDTVCGNQSFIIEPFDCPQSEETTETGSLQPYGTAGACLGPCRDATAVDFTYPDVYYFTPTQSCGGPDYGTCGHGLACNPADVPAQYASSPIQDVRHPNAIAAGCSPCDLVQGLDVTITGVDAAGNVVLHDIHIN